MGLGDVAAPQPVPATPSRLLPRLLESPLLLGTLLPLHSPVSPIPLRHAPSRISGDLAAVLHRGARVRFPRACPSVDGKPPRVLAPPALRKSMNDTAHAYPMLARRSFEAGSAPAWTHLFGACDAFSAEDAIVAIVYFSNACCHDREDDLHPSSSALVVFFCTGCSAYLHQLFPPVYNLSFVSFPWCAQRDAPHASVGWLAVCFSLVMA
jgi:hypothetical protein